MKRRTCSKCNKGIHLKNKSGLCSLHYKLKKNKEYRLIRKEKNICLNCGKKVNPIITYPDGIKGIKTIRYPLRCYKCRSKR